MANLRERVLEFLYKQVSENKIPMIRKGMVEDLENFVLLETTGLAAKRSAEKVEEAMKLSSPVEFKINDESEEGV